MERWVPVNLLNILTIWTLSVWRCHLHDQSKLQSKQAIVLSHGLHENYIPTCGIIITLKKKLWGYYYGLVLLPPPPAAAHQGFAICNCDTDVHIKYMFNTAIDNPGWNSPVHNDENQNGPQQPFCKKTRQLGHPRSPANRFRSEHHNFLFVFYIQYFGYSFPLSISTIWGNHLPFNFMLKFPIYYLDNMLKLIPNLINLSCELGHMMTTHDFLT